jgi:hypothetical protein
VKPQHLILRDASLRDALQDGDYPGHKVSRKYLPLYVAEFQFRYNNRENENIFAEAIRSCLNRHE